MTVHRLDRCAVCHTAIDLDDDAWVCEHNVATCLGCDERDACGECNDRDFPAPNLHACEPGIADAILLAHYRKGPIR